MDAQKLLDLQAKFRVRRDRIRHLAKIQRDFFEKFPLDKLHEILSLESYVIGKPDTFCYWIEHETAELGRMRIRSAADYGVYFNNKTQSYCVREGRGVKEVNQTEAQERFDEVKGSIIKLIECAKNDDIDKILDITLYRHFKEKIISLYFPGKFLTIFSKDHIDHFLKKFGLFDENIKGLDTIRKKRLLLEFKNKDEAMKDWSPYEYMDFLYEAFPPSGGEHSGVWLEKVYVEGREHKEQGALALGKALLSPQRSRKGADIYRNMRLIRKDDLVLHLVDNRAIVGISKVVEGYDPTFTYLREWDNEEGSDPGYIVRLGGFFRFRNPINREDILSDRYKDELISILRSEGNVFYNRNLNLRQGAYLTAVPKRLLKIFNAIYRGKNDSDFPYLVIEGYPSREHVEKAIKELRKEKIDRNELMDKIEEIMAKEKISLEENWKDKTWDNIKSWADKITE